MQRRRYRQRKTEEQKQAIIAELKKGTLDLQSIIARWDIEGLTGLRYIAKLGGLTIRNGVIVPHTVNKPGRPKGSSKNDGPPPEPRIGTLSRMVYDKLAAGVRRKDPKFLQYCKQNLLSPSLVCFVEKRFFKRVSTQTRTVQ